MFNPTWSRQVEKGTTRNPRHDAEAQPGRKQRGELTFVGLLELLDKRAKEACLARSTLLVASAAFGLSRVSHSFFPGMINKETSQAGEAAGKR